MNKLLAHPVLGAILRFSAFCIVVLLSYLCQVSVIPYFKIGGVTPNLLLVTISVITVGFGRLRGFWTGAIFGILLEVMTPTVRLLNMVIYTAGAIIVGFFFADKTQQQLDYRRTQGRSGYNMNPLLRTLLCCLVLTIGYHVVNMLKIYLSGYALLPIHYYRALGAVLFTEGLCLVMMLPIRLFLGLHYVPVRKEKPLHYQEH